MWLEDLRLKKGLSIADFKSSQFVYSREWHYSREIIVYHFIRKFLLLPYFILPFCVCVNLFLMVLTKVSHCPCRSWAHLLYIRAPSPVSSYKTTAVSDLVLSCLEIACHVCQIVWFDALQDYTINPPFLYLNSVGSLWQGA